MADYNALFAKMGFQQTIKRFCSTLGWKIAEITDKKAVLKFTMDSGSTQTIWILLYDSTVEFSVPSALVFDSEKEVPDFLSTQLLQTNSKNKIGFWAIETIGGK